jgi:hypothetical protein
VTSPLENAQQFLLEASRVASSSLEIEAIMRSLVTVVVPNHADYCVIELLTQEGRITRAAVARADRRVHPAGKLPNPLIAEVVRRSEATIVPEVTEIWLTRLLRRSHPALARKLRARSFIAVPLRGRDQIMCSVSSVMP